MRPCPACRGFGGWWEWIPGPSGLRRAFAAPGTPRPRHTSRWATYRLCTSCIGGEASCCEGAVGGAGEIGNTGGRDADAA